MNFTELPLQRSYKSCGDNTISDSFLVPALKCTKIYKRSVGFFSSGVLTTIMDGIIALARNKGTIRLIASPMLSEEDINAINSGYEIRDKIINEAFSRDFISEIDKAESSLWYSEAVSQIKSYFSTDKITDTRLLAQYKIVSSKDDEDYRFRCKSLATIYNYFKVQKDKVIVQKKQELNSYINDGSSYSIEHFIISESQQRQMMIKNKEAMFTYTLDEKIYKKYVNSIFNFIFVSQNLNSDLGNYWLPSKLNVIKSNDIECEYSQLVIKHSLKIAQKMQSLSLEEDNFKDSLDLFFARDYKDQYLELSKTVLDAVIERIKN